MESHSADKRPSSRVYGRLVLLTLGMAFALVVLGGVVRVTGSGLGCPDWPLCNGKIIPSFTLPTLIEYSHRLVASVVGILVLATTLVAWKAWRGDKVILLTANLALGVVILLVILGGIVVIKELAPSIVTLHLASAEVLVGTLTVLYVVIRRHDLRTLDSTGGVQPGPGLIWLTGAAVLAIGGLIFSGAYVRSTGATFVCNLWPFCGPEYLPTEGLPGIHMAHRLVTLVATGLLTVALFTVWRHRRNVPGGAALTIVIAVLFILQVALGAAVIYSGYSQLTRGVHLAMATGIWMGVVALAALTWQSHLQVGYRRSELAEKGRTYSSSDMAASSRFLAYLELTKPPIVGLLLLTSLGGAFLAAGGPPPLGITLWVLLGGGLTAGGASALNHYVERDIDGQMKRTRARPIPSLRVSPTRALVFGMLLNIAGFLILMVGANALSAVLALVASGFYVLVYTRWLKMSTPQNIVIGGAAGAMPPVVAWAAITGSLTLPALYLFLIIFLWTPPHFWALALLLKDDYANVGIPMLPVVRGERHTIQASVRYTVVLVASTLIFYAASDLGLVYLASAMVLGGLFIWQAARLLRSAERRRVLGVYKYSCCT